MTLFLVAILLFYASFAGIFGLFKKANVEKPWRAFIPIWNAVVMQRMSKKSPWWAILIAVPFFNIFFFIVFSITFVQLFGKMRWYERLAVAAVPFIYLPYIGFDKETAYKGYDFVQAYPKSKIGTIIYDLAYAVFLVMLVNTFLLQSYIIPTPSMEGSLLVNDYLFVTKFNYGIRLPNTPLSLPIMHNTIPVLEVPSYTNLVSLDYRRWWSRKASRGDIMVFNFPMDDTSINKEGFKSARTYYEECRLRGREYVIAHPKEYPLMYRPVDKKENFIKRAVGAPGDSIFIKDAFLYVNGVETIYPNEQYLYIVQTTGVAPDAELLKEEIGVDWDALTPLSQDNFYYGFFTRTQGEKLRSLSFVKSVELSIEKWEDASHNFLRDAYAFSSRPFPYDTSLFHWSRDNYGPIWIPRKGATIALDKKNAALYGRAISAYEHNAFEEKEDGFYINGKPAKQYTFTMDYYWLMGDNRHNSLDSRYWGFVPEDHVIGKAAFIWYSSDKNGIRWKRMFRAIR